MSYPQIAIDIDFMQVRILHYALSEYLSKSHNFKNLFFCDITLVVFCLVVSLQEIHIINIAGRQRMDSPK